MYRDAYFLLGSVVFEKIHTNRCIFHRGFSALALASLEALALPFAGKRHPPPGPLCKPSSRFLPTNDEGPFPVGKSPLFLLRKLVP